jgi:hypothetical protein
MRGAQHELGADVPRKTLSGFQENDFVSWMLNIAIDVYVDRCS